MYVGNDNQNSGVRKQRDTNNLLLHYFYGQIYKFHHTHTPLPSGQK